MVKLQRTAATKLTARSLMAPPRTTMYLVLAASALVGEAVGTPLLHLADVTADAVRRADRQ